MRNALLGLLALLAAQAHASEIYRYTDAQGNTVFTNQPPEHVQAAPVELSPTNSVDIRTPEPPPAPVSETQPGSQPYRHVVLLGIPEGNALRANNGTFVVSAELDPPLRPGHRLRFVLDGIPQAEPSQATSLQLYNVERGQHRLEVQVLQGERVIQRSEPQLFTVQRVHTSSPAQRGR